ncbi:hypothetical protein [Pedosphaera parvula]|uniref:Uncharacterized protein n=1 Tax=Pedosphaera parvula (strain Ellin514) TaxID=320771 RepID=B9XMG6_PEDPL|nr:hypothetical protein [Pedosphaera parvula]EEF59008.1 hypothetical protein Cflav_PD2057 [Pedosphaera parvula Ellin514]
MLRLFIVADRFQIAGRGCVLVPGLPCEPGDPIVHRGARIRLRTPTGREIDTFVKELELISYRKRPQKFAAPVLLPHDIMKDDVPVGTEVLLLEETYKTVKQPGT